MVVLTGCSLLREKVPVKVISVKEGRWVPDTMYQGFESEALGKDDTDAFVYWHNVNEMNGHQEYNVVVEFESGSRATVRLDYEPKVGETIMY